MEFILASLAILAAWLTYRFSIINEKKKINNIMIALINNSKEWLGKNYPDNIGYPNWYDPSRIVFKIDATAIPTIISSSLVSKEIAEQFSYYSQGILRFNQLIDHFSAFINSDPYIYRKAEIFYKRNLLSCENIDDCHSVLKKLKECDDKYTEEFIKETNILQEDKCDKETDDNYEKMIRMEQIRLGHYFERLFMLKKWIHTSGIGDDSAFPSGYPTLRRSFLNIEGLLKSELHITFKLLSWSKYMFSDIIFIIISSIIIVTKLLLNVVPFVSKIINCNFCT